MKPRVGGSKPSVVCSCITTGKNSSAKKKSFLLHCVGVTSVLVIVLQLYLFGVGIQTHLETTTDTSRSIHHSLSSVTTTSNNRINKKRKKKYANATATVAYAISLIKCSDKQTTDVGLIDAALVLQHSIHQISIRNPVSQSRYDYRMYAIIHPQAEACSQVLATVGFELVRIDEPPIHVHEIKGTYLRENIETEWCCGSAEFIKLYAYTLPEPLVVHVDIDFLFLKPLDDLFDAILYPHDSEKGRRARSRIPLEQQPEPNDGVVSSLLPDTIDAFITRDWAQVIPGRKALYQAGFLVARRNPNVLEEAIAIVKEGNYKEGYELRNGWGGAGYGAFVGGK